MSLNEALSGFVRLCLPLVFASFRGRQGAPGFSLEYEYQQVRQ